MITAVGAFAFGAATFPFLIALAIIFTALTFGTLTANLTLPSQSTPYQLVTLNCILTILAFTL